MRKLNRVLLPAALAAVAMCASAQTVPTNVRPAGSDLSVGDNAPSLIVSKWVKGTPVDSLDKGKIYVVEFWATWCGPCKVSIPHLTELQKKFGDKATFIGVDSFEQDWSLVEPFVNNEGDQMDYNVAVDKVDKPTDREGFMAKNWMDAAHQPVIPTAFIIDGDGKVAWIGHPMKLEDPLSQVIAGTWDRAAAAKDFAAQMEQMRRQEEEQRKQMNSPAGKMQQKLMVDIRAKDYAAALADLDKLESLDKGAAANLRAIRLQVYTMAGDAAHYSAYASKLVDGAAKDNPMLLNQIAWGIVDPKSKMAPRDIKLAIKAAFRGVEVSQRKQAALIDTLAWCYYWKGDKARAIDLENEAISKIGPGDNKSDYDMSMHAFKGE